MGAITSVVLLLIPLAGFLGLILQGSGSESGVALAFCTVGAFLASDFALLMISYRDDSSIVKYAQWSLLLIVTLGVFTYILARLLSVSDSSHGFFSLVFPTIYSLGTLIIWMVALAIARMEPRRFRYIAVTFTVAIIAFPLGLAFSPSLTHSGDSGFAFTISMLLSPGLWFAGYIDRSAGPVFWLSVSLIHISYWALVIAIVIKLFSKHGAQKQS